MGLMTKIKALIDSIPFIKTPQITGLPLIAINLLKFHKEAKLADKGLQRQITLKSLNKKKAVHIHSERMLAKVSAIQLIHIGVHADQNT